MNFIAAFGKGFIEVFRKLRMWILLYMVNFIAALFLAISLFDLLEDKLSHSLVVDRILPDFDYIVYQDFMHEYGDAVNLIMGQSIYLSIFFIVLYIFLTGGILEVFKEHSSSFRSTVFWSGCHTYFWRLFRLTVYFLIIHSIILGLFVMIFITPLRNGLAGVESDAAVFRSLKIIAVIYFFVAGIFFMIHDYAKIHLVHRNPSWLFDTILDSFRFSFRHFSGAWPLYLLNALVLAGLVVGYWYFSKSITMSNAATIALALLLGQIFIFARIGTKLLNLSSATFLYQRIIPPQETSALAGRSTVPVKEPALPPNSTGRAEEEE